VLGTRDFKDQNSTLALNRVDFISTDVQAANPRQALGKAVFSRFSKVVFVNDSTFSANVGGSRSLLDPGNPDSNLIYGGFAPLTSTAKPTDLPVHEATSSVWNKEFADIRTPVLTNTVGIADTNIVNYEQSGRSVIGVDADLSDPSNPLNALWKAVRPDQADELQSKYQAEISKSLWQAFGLKKPGQGQGAVSYALDNLVIPNLADLVGGLLPIGKEASKLLSNLLTMGYSNTQLRNQLDSDLRKNAQDQAKLQEYLQSNNKAQIGTIDTKLGRAPVLIKNFTIGEDILFIPAFGEGTNGESLKFEEATQGNGWRSIRISAAQSKQSSVLTEICIIEVDPASIAALGNVAGQSIPSYLLSMTERRGNGDWVLGSRVVKPSIQKITSFLGGPAGTDVLIDRGNNRDAMVFNTITGDADDQVYGSDGFEEISTNAGCDIIAPGLGKDFVNAGKNADTVAYASLKQSIRAIGSSLPQNAQILSSIAISAISGGPNTTKILDSELDNVEIIQAYGDSVFDFSNLPDPYLNGDGFYSVRTGAGSEFKGSKFNDVVILSYDADTNDSVAAAFLKTTLIDGGTGNGDTNSFYADYSIAPEAVNLQATGSRAFTIKNSSGLTLAQLRNIDVVNLDGSAQSDNFDFRAGSARMSETFDFSAGLARYYVHGNDGNDTFWAGSMGSEDHFYGGAGDDIFYGGSSNDYFDGDDGDDRLLGADGSDYLVANKGSDLLVGGLGGDNFLIQDCPQATLADFTASDADRLILDLIATVTFAEVSGEEELRKAIDAGEANFIYDENARVAQWRGDDQNTYQTISFDSPVSSADLRLSVFGRDEVLQDPDSNVDPVTRSSAALIATFLDGKERLFADNPFDALGLAADPQLAYRWFYNGYLIAGANAASYSDSVLEELPSGSYIRETVYTDRASRRQTVASEPLLVEPTREGSGLRVLRTSLDQRQRANLDTIQSGFQASPEVLQLRLPVGDSSSLPGVERIDLMPTGGATGDTDLVALVDPVALLDPNQDGPATGPLAEPGQGGAGVYDFDSDGLLDTLTWQPQPSGTSSPTLNTSLLTGTISTLAALPDGTLRFLLSDADGVPQPLKQPALQCLSVVLLESPPRMSSVMAIGLNEGETLEGLSADQRRQRAINLISHQDDTPAPLESYADLYRQLWVRADLAMVLFEVPGGNASTWDGSLLSEPLKVVAPLQDPLAEPLPDGLGPTLELGSASGLRLGLLAENVPVDLNGFVARSQTSAPVLDFRGLGGLNLDITLEVAREAGF